jgi:hypothetical protein
MILTAMGGVVLSEDGSLVATRIMALAASYAAEEMLSARGTLRASPLGPAAFTNSETDIYWEQDAIMPEFTLQVRRAHRTRSGG